MPLIIRTIAAAAAAAALTAAPATASGPAGLVAPDDVTTDRTTTAVGQTRAHECFPRGTSWLDVEHDGETYPVRVHLPGDVVADDLPVVLNLHPSGSNAEGIAAYNRLDDTADAHGFVTVAPNAVIPASDPNPDGNWFWNVPGVPTVAGEYPPEDTRDDVDFLSAVIDTVVGAGCVDPQRVYLTGFSGGARMASAYACARPEKVAAIAPVAGLRAGRPAPDDPSAVELQSCAPEQSVPTMTFHGDADGVNPYQGNDDKRWGYTMQLAVQSWARLDGCRTGPEVVPYSEHVTTETYTDCEDGAEVVLQRVTGGSHTWPGSDNGTPEIDASEVMWEFFERYSR